MRPALLCQQTGSASMVGLRLASWSVCGGREAEGSDGMCSSCQCGSGHLTRWAGGWLTACVHVCVVCNRYMTGGWSGGLMMLFFVAQVPLLAVERRLGAALT